MNLQEYSIIKKYSYAYYISEGESIEKKKENLEKIIVLIEKYIDFLSHPFVNIEIKNEIIGKIVSNELKKTLAYRLALVLISSSKIKLIDKIYSVFMDYYNESKGYIRVDLRVKNIPSKNEEEKLKDFLKDLIQKKPLLNFIKDDSIIGGFYIRWDDKVLDLTLNKRLEIIKNQLEKEINYEV